MLYKSLHNRWLRLFAALVGAFIAAAALNLFIVPLELYTGGLLGLCQVARTLAQTYLGVNFGTYDVAGIIYFLLNIPILLLAYKTLGRGLVFRTIVCTLAYSFFYSVIPIPRTPIVDDYLTACLLGGILSGVGSGIVLTCGCSAGGLDIVGLCLSKRGSSFTVGKFSLTFNVFLYGACLILFVPEVAIYSVIYNFFTSMVLDRMHQQNVNVQALIFTKDESGEVAQYVMKKLGRGVTSWTGTGAYTGAALQVLMVCLSKYEIEELLRAVHSIDEHAFITVQEHVHIYGNFRKKLD